MHPKTWARLGTIQPYLLSRLGYSSRLWIRSILISASLFYEYRIYAPLSYGYPASSPSSHDGAGMKESPPSTLWDAS
jgi:hypothetical protein